MSNLTLTIQSLTVKYQPRIPYDTFVYTYLLSSVLDRHLVDHILYWFSRRYVSYITTQLIVVDVQNHSYRLTAGVIEILIHFSPNRPSHHIITFLILQLTGFTVTDAEDLEDKEDLISKDMQSAICNYGPLTSATILFSKADR